MNHQPSRSFFDTDQFTSKLSVSHSSKVQSARAKAMLLARGVQDTPHLFSNQEFKQDNYAYNNGNWEVNSKRSVPTEVYLPGGITSKIYVRPWSPLKIVSDNNPDQPSYAIYDGDRFVSECSFLPTPNFWNFETELGTPTRKLAQLYGRTCININIYSGCQFFGVKKQCAFCSVQPTQIEHGKAVIKKSPADVADACRLAVEHDEVNWFLQTGGSYLNSDTEFDRHVEVLKAIRPHLPWNGRFKGNVALMPPRDLSRIVELYDLGVDHPAFNLEVWPRSAFEKFCPGKAKYVGFDHIIDAMTEIVRHYGPGWGWCNFVGGLVPLDDQKAGFTFVAERGIIPGANIYHPDIGATVSHEQDSPSEDYILSLYAHAAELYHRYNYKPFFDAEVLRNSLANEAYEGLF